MRRVTVAAAAARALLVLLTGVALLPPAAGNPDAKRLYDDLLSNYNKLVRPVLNVSDALTVRIKLKLSQLIDVVSVTSVDPLPCYTRLATFLYNYFLLQNLKNQIMTTNLWVEQVSYLCFSPARAPLTMRRARAHINASRYRAGLTISCRGSRVSTAGWRCCTCPPTISGGPISCFIISIKFI